ncbi:LOW QUALITY PROTEIN: hypothetical protein PHMEG_00032021, partial [Phytophthora megakarya]
SKWLCLDEEAHEKDALADVALRLVNRVEYKPEEHKDMDAVIQDAWKAGAAKRKAAQEEKESSTSRKEPSPEPAVQGVHQAA